ncbi:MAG: hypothetical protein IKP22_15070 [Clostridia bacterium]|nr:hypothetical protein [Clostridia bacterium]
MENTVLQSETLSAVFMPRRGGKLASLVYRPAGMQMLAQPPGAYPPLRAGMPFGEGDASGFDDVFPSMGEAGKEGEWPPVPDHGMIWTSPMEASYTEGGLLLHLWADGWDYRKTARLDEDTLRLRWEIRNDASAARPFCWVCHCLWQLDQDTVFLYPPSGREARDVLKPGAPSCDVIPSPPPDGSMAKFYFSRPLQTGQCGCIWPTRGVNMSMRWDAAELPYLGFWITNGGWRGDRNFAFEPGLSYYDTLSESSASGTLRTAGPGETVSFELMITLGKT